ncbi:hypothetical protein GCM10009639_24390 [Kitasatospora putterlickiae]|uniref:JAB-N domain-containing protein n=1 Tax=Kitasatospora putterlickiae TaxID=221725 RepID=A0ABP4IP98_9ACTN
MSGPGAVEVELFRGDGYVPVGALPLLPLLHDVFAAAVGGALPEDARFELSFLPVPDPREPSGSPSLVNLKGSHGYVRVRIVSGDRVLYQHPHTVREVVGRPLRELLSRRFPEETHWGFGVRGPGLESVALVRPAPEPEKQVRLTGNGPRRGWFQLNEMAEPDPPLGSLAGLGVEVPAGEPPQALETVLHEAVHEELVRTRRFSGEVEEGGFLAGYVHRNQDAPDGWIVEVSGAVPAERTGASLLHFTFTGESYLRIGEALTARGLGEQLVGWYHTHLFPATDTFGLSTADVDLHLGTFRRDWQIAALLNVDRDRRVLRVYRRGPGRRMSLLRHRVRPA